MEKERDTAILPARVKKETIAIIRERAKKKGMTINAWMNWAIATILNQGQNQREEGVTVVTLKQHKKIMSGKASRKEIMDAIHSIKKQTDNSRR